MNARNETASAVSFLLRKKIVEAQKTVKGRYPGPE